MRRCVAAARAVLLAAAAAAAPDPIVEAAALYLLFRSFAGWCDRHPHWDGLRCPN